MLVASAGRGNLATELPGQTSVDKPKRLREAPGDPFTRLARRVWRQSHQLVLMLERHHPGHRGYHRPDNSNRSRLVHGRDSREAAVAADADRRAGAVAGAVQSQHQYVVAQSAPSVVRRARMAGVMVD